MAELLTHLNSDGVPLYLRIYAAQVLEGAIHALQWTLHSEDEVAACNILQLVRSAIDGLSGLLAAHETRLAGGEK